MPKCRGFHSRLSWELESDWIMTATAPLSYLVALLKTGSTQWACPLLQSPGLDPPYRFPWFPEEGWAHLPVLSSATPLQLFISCSSSVTHTHFPRPWPAPVDAVRDSFQYLSPCRPRILFPFLPKRRCTVSILSLKNQKILFITPLFPVQSALIFLKKSDLSESQVI